MNNQNDWYIFNHIESLNKISASYANADIFVDLISILYSGGSETDTFQTKYGSYGLKGVDTFTISDFSERGVYIGSTIKNCKIIDVENIIKPIDLADYLNFTMLPLIKENRVPIFIGGDHSITYGILSILNNLKVCNALIWFDAHLDVSSYRKKTMHNGSVLKYIVDNKLIDENKIVILGYREQDEETIDFLRNFKGLAISSNEISKIGLKKLKDRISMYIDQKDKVYWSLDIDVLEPSLAPGTTYRMPGGLTVRELFNIVYLLKDYAPVAADIVEYNPSNDFQNITASIILRYITQLTEIIIIKNKK